jgi:hypothetical protein
MSTLNSTLPPPAPMSPPSPPLSPASTALPPLNVGMLRVDRMSPPPKCWWGCGSGRRVDKCVGRGCNYFTCNVCSTREAHRSSFRMCGAHLELLYDYRRPARDDDSQKTQSYGDDAPANPSPPSASAPPFPPAPARADSVQALAYDAPTNPPSPSAPPSEPAPSLRCLCGRRVGPPVRDENVEEEAKNCSLRSEFTGSQQLIWGRSCIRCRAGYMEFFGCSAGRKRKRANLE